MPGGLKISVGQYSDKGRKEANQDFHGVLLPEEPLLTAKGVAVVLADGISSSEVGHIASESAVKSFLTDYYCTSETWTVKTSAQRVIAAANSWLYAQTRRSRNPYDRDKGYVCTLSALVVKSTTAHIFHIGDSRIYRVVGRALEQLTEDHRVIVSADETYLGRALGIGPQVEIDYLTLKVQPGDIFVLATDGVYEHVGPSFMLDTIAGNAGDLDAAAHAIVAEAFRAGSGDNLTVQIVRVDAVPAGQAREVAEQAAVLPPAPLLEAREVFEGYRVIRELHSSSRSHIYLAADIETEDLVALKVPSLDLRGDASYLKRFAMEEWVARRINSAHVLKPCFSSRRRNYLYVTAEFIEGKTLRQWMADSPRPDLETVRGIVEQIGAGLQAFHRMEIVHQDIRPDNVMIDRTGTVKIIDFGSVSVAGVVEEAPSLDGILGTVQYTAPEYFLGESGSSRADIFSLGVIAYQMLTGKLPYGAQVAKTRTKAQQRKLKYASALDDQRAIPAWVDKVLQKAVHPDPEKRYGELSEFLYDLRHPRKEFLEPRPAPLMERRPLLFWQGLCFALVCAVLYLLARQHGLR
jgi:serine/threonine protein phosphatase PrpC/predicted Ser/Thr protein kinase